MRNCMDLPVVCIDLTSTLINLDRQKSAKSGHARATLMRPLPHTVVFLHSASTLKHHYHSEFYGFVKLVPPFLVLVPPFMFNFHYFVILLVD